MKKITITLVSIVVLASIVYSGYSLFTNLRTRYVTRGFNYALTQVKEQADKNGHVEITIDGQTTSLITNKK